MKEHMAIILMGWFVICLSASCHAVTSISENQYVDTYFNLSRTFYYGDAPVENELMDMIEYYLSNQPDLGAKLSTIGNHSGKQIRTIVDLYGGPCDECIEGDVCPQESSKCCCRGKEYLCVKTAGPPGAGTITAWTYFAECTKGCCGPNVCCYDPGAGDGCYGDSECYEKRGPCYRCPSPNGNCAISTSQCTADSDCTSMNGAGWRCISTCCIPTPKGDACTSDAQCSTYGINWICQTPAGAPSGNCAYLGNYRVCSDGTLIGKCSTANKGQICIENNLSTGTQLASSPTHCPTSLVSVENLEETTPPETTSTPEKKTEDKSIKFNVPFLGDISIPWF